MAKSDTKGEMEMPTRYAMTAATRNEGLGGIRAYAVPQASATGHWTPYDEAVQLEAERNAALARLKELEALTAEQRLVIACWTETSAAQQARIAKLEADVADDACYRVVARYKEDATIPGATWLEDRLKRLAELEKLRTTSQESKLTDLASLRELAAIRKDAIAHGFREEGVTASGDGLAAWLDRKLTAKAELARVSAVQGARIAYLEAEVSALLAQRGVLRDRVRELEGIADTRGNLIGAYRVKVVQLHEIAKDALKI